MEKKKKNYLDLLYSREGAVKLSKMSKEDRLKAVCRRYMYIAFEVGKVVGGGLKSKKYKATCQGLEGFFNKAIGGELTRAFKKAGVLPLEKAKTAA